MVLSEVVLWSSEVKKCAVCGSLTLEDDDLFGWCPVCNWSQDEVAEEMGGLGANCALSLLDAKRYWNKYHKPIPDEVFQSGKVE